MFKFITFASLLVFGCGCAPCARAQQASFTPDEASALDKFRLHVQDVLYADYMKTDEYLINWLRDKHLDIDKASEKLRKSIKWRLENNIDGILENDSYPDGKANAPHTFEGYDNFRRPILSTQYSKWHIRKLALMGKRTQYRKQMQAMMEFYTRLARGQGRNVTQAIIISDMSGFNLRLHGCLACIPLYTDWISDYDAHYPLSIKEAIIIKAPAAYVATLQIVRPLMSPALRNIFQVFGYDKTEYMQYIFKNISPDQIGLEFGGTKNIIR